MKSDKGRILFIEDERNMVDMYHLFFEKNGYDFLSTKDIKEALMITEFERPDAVLLDIIIPTEENTIAEQGYDYLEAVKKNPNAKNAPIIVFTNLDTDQDRDKCRRMGAESYIFKGQASPRQVLNTIQDVIAKYQKK